MVDRNGPMLCPACGGMDLRRLADLSTYLNPDLGPTEAE